MSKINIEAVAGLMEDVELTPEETESIYSSLGDLTKAFAELESSENIGDNKDIVSWMKTSLTPELIFKLQSQIGKNRKLMALIQKIFMKKLNEI